MNFAVLKHIIQKKQTGNLEKNEQIVEGVISAIESRELKKGDMLPSVNVSVSELGMARKTIVKAYEELRVRGIIESKKRLGYYIASDNVKQKVKAMMILSAYHPYHEKFHEAYTEALQGEDVATDLYFHHYNVRLLKTLIEDNQEQFGRFIITPFEHPDMQKLLKAVDPKKLLFVLRDVPSVPCSRISQDFGEQTFRALGQVAGKIKKYKKLVLIASAALAHPRSIADAVRRYCGATGIAYAEAGSLAGVTISKGDAFLVVDDNALVEIIIRAKQLNLRPGTDIGIISYNDTPAKQVMADGITTISADFAYMGKKAAEWLLSKKQVEEIVSAQAIIRESL